MNDSTYKCADDFRDVFKNINWIPGEGPASAELMIVGEAGGKEEDEARKPFVGKSGKLVDDILKEIGIDRNKVYITNIVKCRPPNNKLDRLEELGVTIGDFIPFIRDEINNVKPNCILALGGTALKYLTGKDKITHYRGSILPYIEGYPKVVSTLHPANFLESYDSESSGLYKWSQLAYVRLDFKRAYEQSKFKEFRLPERNLWICKSSLDLMRYLQRNLGRSCALDIETYKTIPIALGISFHKSEAISIPLCDMMTPENPKGIGRDELRHIWSIVGEMLYDARIQKIGQNFKFDEGRLRDISLYVRGFHSDTMLKFHCCYAEFPKSLEFIASILTDEPYYKSEGREYNPKKDDFSRLLLYNAKDAAVTKEVDDILEEELREYGVYDYFYNFEMKKHYLYTHIEDQGLRRDPERRKIVIEKYINKREGYQKKLNDLSGQEVNVASNPQVCNLIYNELNCPQRTRLRGKGHSTLTADEKAISSLLSNIIKDERRRDILQSILDVRSCDKTLGTYLGVPK